MLPAKAHVEVDITRTEARISIRTNRTLIGGVIVPVYLSTGVEVERMSAVVLEDRRQLEALEDGLLPRTVQHRSHHHFVPLVERRNSAIEVQVCRILRTEVGVEIGSGVDGFAVGVICEEREIVAQALRHLQNPTFIQTRRCGCVLVVLNHKRIYEA